MNLHLKSAAEFKQNQRNGFNGIHVAIYFPLSFVTSFFRMNVMEISDSANIRQSWTQLTSLSLTVLFIVLGGFHVIRGLKRLPHPVYHFHNASFNIFAENFVWLLESPKTIFVKTFWREPLAVNILLTVLSALKTLQRIQRRRRSERYVLRCWSGLIVVSCICAGLSHLDRTSAIFITPLAFASLPLVAGAALTIFEKMRKFYRHLT